jgi:hypothetical protein
MQRITEELELELELKLELELSLRVRAPITAFMAGHHSEAEVVNIACGVELTSAERRMQPWIETETAAQRDVYCKAHAGRHGEKEGRKSG